MLLASVLAAALTAAPSVANYNIRVELDPAERALRGQQRIGWINGTSATATTLQLHLYLNAFRDRGSTFLRDEEFPPGEWKGVDDPWGWIEIDEIRLARGEDLSPGMRFIAPDDGNPRDRTVVEVRLPRPVPPGGKLEIDLTFHARMPHLLSRTGRRGDFYFLAQWYPALGVFEAAPGGGRWNCHQFHPASEFFADFGSYDVEISVPPRFVIAGPGDPVESYETEGRRTERYHLSPAHDFAWSAWPGFTRTQTEFQRAGDRPMTLRIYHPRNRRAVARRHAAILEKGVLALEEWIGRYPYDHLTVVEAPPEAAEDVEWMEYPALITLHAPRLLTVWPFRNVRILDFGPFDLDWNLEEVDLHELGHQWWYGTVATNEFEDPWMDEGINSYVTSKLVDHLYGPNTSAFEILGLKAGAMAHNRHDYLSLPDSDPSSAPAWGFLDTDVYSNIAYEKVEMVFRTFEGIVGEETVLRALRRLYETGAFRHPRTPDFLRILERESGRDMSGLWSQLMDGTGTIDYRVEWVRELKEDDPRWLVAVGRGGSLVLPAWVEFRYADGSTERSRWEAQQPWTRYTLRSESPLVRVEIDPDRQVPLDLNRINNGWAAESGNGARRWAWVASALSSLWLDLCATLL